MSSTWGNHIKISIFGESHASAIGVVMDGVPAGTRIDEDKLYAFMKRRQAVDPAISTPRKEEDIPEFLCGVKDFVAEGTPICMLQKIDAFHAPQLKIGLFRNKERDTLCVLINHMLCDAAGFKDFLSLLSSTYTRLFLEPNYIPLSVIGGREVNALMKSYSKTDKRRMILYKNNKKLHGCDANFACEGNLDNPFIAVKTISKERFQKIKTYAKAQHATINDVVLTAFIRTFYTCQGSVISVPCTMDLRKFMPNHKANGICNLVTNVICDIGIEMGNTFGETLFKVKKAMDKAKTDVAFLSPIAKLNLAYRHLPYRATKYIVKKVFSNPTVAFTNIGILDPTHLTFGNTTMVSAFMLLFLLKGFHFISLTK